MLRTSILIRKYEAGTNYDNRETPNPSLDPAVAAMLVVLFHGQLAFSTHIAEPGFASRFDGGFNAKGFMRRRLLRINPIYWICAALYLCVHVLIRLSYEIPFGQLVGALMLLPGDVSAIINPA